MECLCTQAHQKAEAGVAHRDTKVMIDKGRKKSMELGINLDFINIKPNWELLTPDSEKILGRIALNKMGCNFKYHIFRHTHASFLAEKGLPVVTVKTRLVIQKLRQPKSITNT
jgi:hypothetical protein